MLREEALKIDKAFSYQFEDIHWPRKLGLGALISLVPILNLAIVGYMVGIIRNVAHDVAEPLPEWDKLGSKFREGLILTAASLVYAGPVFVAICLPLGVLAASGIVLQSSDWQALGRSLGGVGGVLFLCLLGLSLCYTLLLSIIRPVIMILFSRDGTFRSCFRLREILSILTRFPQPFFTTWVVIVLAGVVIGLIVGFINLIAGWIPCLGWIVGLALAAGSTMYILTIDAYLFGQFGITALAEAPSDIALHEPQRNQL